MVGRLTLHYTEESPDEVLAALDDKTEAVIHELEARLSSLNLPLRDRTYRVQDERDHGRQWRVAR